MRDVLLRIWGPWPRHVLALLAVSGVLVLGVPWFGQLWRILLYGDAASQGVIIGGLLLVRYVVRWWRRRPRKTVGTDGPADGDRDDKRRRPRGGRA